MTASPLSAFADRFARASAEQIRLRELPPVPQRTLRVAPGSEAARAVADRLGLPLPIVPNTVRTRGALSVVWMGPDEWLIVGGELDELPGTTVVDVSAQRTVIELAGADARELLRKGCALDLHPDVFAVGRCAQTLLARAQVLLVARDREPAFHVFVRASFAEYVAEWLLDAAAEYRGAPPLDLSPRPTFPVAAKRESC